MIYCLYVRTRPKGNWYVLSSSTSLEMINQDRNKVIEQARKENNFDIETGLQQYETKMHIPDFIPELKEQKIVFN